MDKQPCVYILANKSHSVLYTGVTNDLARRVSEHRNGEGSKFTTRYKTYKLVFVEPTERMEDAIAREKQIKAGSRQKKLDLINRLNPDWKDLFEEYFS